MLNLLVRSLSPVLQWATVIVTTAVVVISIQVVADGHGTANHSQSIEAIPVADVLPKPSSSAKPWSPASGFADLIEQVSPAVVHVAISGKVKSRLNHPEFSFPPGSPFEDFFERFRERQAPESEERSRPLGIGSGFIISEDGYVVTNDHVIKDADEIVVTLTDGEEYKAELVGSDSKTDLALLKLEDANDLDYVAWGDDEQSRVGDWVVAIGNPFGLGGSASTGIISARGRDIRSGPYDDYIQVDAAINRGNSGGPLFNMNGEVIGINTAIYSPNGGSVGIGFSIPASLAKSVISQLQESGQVQRGWIGVEIQALTDELAEGFERENDHGALISSVVPDAPADKAGLKAGDIILEFDNQEVKKMRDLPRLVAQAPVGEKYPLTVWRDGKRKTLTLKTETFPEDPSDVASSGSGSSKKSDKESAIGARLVELDSELKERYELEEDLEGVLVLGVERGGMAARNGLLRGDVITSVNNRRVTTPEDVEQGIEKAKDAGREKIVVLIQRRNASRFLPFDLGDDE